MRRHIFRKIFAFASIILMNVNVAFASSIRDYFINGETHNLDVNKMSSSVYGIIIFLGYAIAVCVILVTGIQFLLANPQKKAQLKEKLWLIALGVLFLAGGSSILLAVTSVIETAANKL